MKAHIITDEEIIQLIEKLELVKLRERMPISSATDMKVTLFRGIHRVFHYEVVKFFDEH